MKNEDEKFVSSEDCSQISDESVQSDQSSGKEVVFDKTPSDSEKSVEFDQSPTDDISDDEEEKHINIAKTHLYPESFHFYFADRLEKLKEKQASRVHEQMKAKSVVQAEAVGQKDEVEKIVEVIKPCEKCLEVCKECAAKDEK
ncbi:hypothetical protein Hanom_Chr05g00411481 [Helianthus anomalus]